MAKSVTKIPQTRNIFTAAPITGIAKRKVAGYARVSTDSDEQFTSYEAQVDYYTRYIQSHPEWEFVKVYTDEGISGTDTRHREGFNEMIEDALAGKIDLIVTKSVSRFARNTVDSLVTIRKLKEHGCECYFEKENIFTFDGKGELLITIMSSLAQEESRSISENVTWGHRKRMADGKVSVAYSTFLGYDKGPDGNLVVNREQAKIVRLIYRSFMEGMAPIGICRMLEERGIPSPGGKKKWYEGTVISILTNEKYRGDALLQKTFTVDFLTKKTKVNEGEVPQYYVEANHEAIIPPEEFEMVQAEIARRKKIGRAYSGTIFGSKIVCGDCGGYYGQKVWHSNDAYRRVVWRCNRKYGQGERCCTPTITEEDIKKLFVQAFNKLMSERTSAITDCEQLATELENTSGLDQGIEATQKEIDTVVEQNRRLIREQAVTGMPTEEFDDRAALLNERYKKADEKLARLKAEREDHLTRGKSIRRFLSALDGQPQNLEDWDEQAWNLLVSRVIIRRKGCVEFVFRGEITITVKAA